MSLLKKYLRYKKVLGLLHDSIHTMAEMPSIADIDDLCLEITTNRTCDKENTVTLDLGCGISPRNPFQAEKVYGIDIKNNLDKNIYHADLVIDQIPFPNEMFDYVSAYDFIEHIPRIIYSPHRRQPFIELMNEIYRVLKPGGIFLSKTPVYPFSETFRDPTHVNYITNQTFSYYFCEKKLAEIYGFNGCYRLLKQGLLQHNLITVMEKNLDHSGVAFGRNNSWHP